MELTVTDTGMKPVETWNDFTLDMAYGVDSDAENDFTLTLPATRSSIGAGSLIMVDGTPWGGMVDSVKTEVVGSIGTISLLGRTWTGLLGSRILQPDANQDYLVVDGDLKTVLANLINRIGLSGLFTVGDCVGKISKYQFDRYVDAYTGICKMLKSCGMRLSIKTVDSVVRLGCINVNTVGGEADSDVIDFEMKRVWHSVNHLICLGNGELRNRLRCDFYADESGQVSDKQSITGLQERVAVFDYSNASMDELKKDGRQKLESLQETSEIKATVKDQIDVEVGDLLVGMDSSTGVTCTAEVRKKILKVSKGVAQTSYEVGAVSTSLTGTAESDSSSSSSSGGSSGSDSGGGHAYYAGAGLKLDNYTFSAEVTAVDLNAVKSTADAANKTASDLSASIGTANETAESAKSTADAAKSTADAAKAGMMTDAERQKLAGIADNANNYTLPVASTDMLGGVKPDGKTIVADSDGVLTVVQSSSGGSSTGGGFLDSHPAGSFFWTTLTVDPNDAYGGEWAEQQTILGGHVWLRNS